MSNELLEKDIVTLGRRQPRIVVLNRIFESMREQCFSADHVRGGVLAAQALVGHGHRRLAVIAGPATSPDNVARIGGFMEEVRRHGLEPRDIPVLASDFSPEGGWASAQALLAGKRQFTGLFCANDEMAVGALSYFHQAGLTVPADVSVIGYDDVHSAAYSAPRLTSVHIPLREVTVSGLNCLLNLCYGSRLPVQRDFSVSVMWRASVATAAQPTRTRRQRPSPA
jgi:LacI family transcriptional regulator